MKNISVYEISLCTIVHSRENVQTWIGFAGLAKGSYHHDGGLLARHRERKNLVKVFDVRDPARIKPQDSDGMPHSRYRSVRHDSVMHGMPHSRYRSVRHDVLYNQILNI